ncbi:hypothetical protein RND71_005474 [Anisodus tanguticus]|uniref:DUF1985 domain-containing protein n=1 Tax=Anisodus tanguticus TaxID=243964 RepID=A0AAE1VMQ2_9SOLA|nr:hypothetical protein RND71_005474 [Anisodus tanguticus]
MADYDGMDANVVEYFSVGVDPKRPSIEDVVKSFSIAKSGAKMPLDDNNDLTGDIVVKLGMGKSFDVFRGTLKEFESEDFFRASCFEYFLELLEGTVVRFLMKMLYELMKRRIICTSKSEIWTNFCDMPICFGMKEFAIVTGLRCYPPLEPIHTVTLKKPAR